MLDEICNKLSIKVSNQYDRVTYDKSTNTLFIPISIDYTKLSSFICKYPYSDLRILSTILISDEVIDAIASNPSIIFIKLGSKDDPYTLTREVFEKLNASESLYSIDTAYVEGEYTTEEMEYLPFFQRLVVQNYSIEDLFTEKVFNFYQNIYHEQIVLLKKYLSSSIKINFYYGDYANILEVIRNLKGKNICFYLEKYDDLSLYTKEFQQLIRDGENISFWQNMDFQQFIRIDMLLELMVKDIKESCLSPYEKYLGVYEIVTHFKEYLENDENRKEARELEYLLFNDYYVCYGISELFKALLDKVGIKAYNVNVEFYKEKEELNEQEQVSLDKQLLYRSLGNKEYTSSLLSKSSNIAYHSRVLVKLKDAKYGIDGIFIADPTWDNHLDKHYFRYSLMTFYEMKLEDKKFYDTDVSIFGVTNTEEFMNMVKDRKEVIPYFLEVIKNIDHSFYQYLEKQYEIDTYSNSLLLTIYQYIIQYTKHSVLEEQRKEALKVLFDFIYPSLSKEERSKLAYEIEEGNGKGKVR